jgi:hypothetical protein
MPLNIHKRHTAIHTACISTAGARVTVLVYFCREITLKLTLKVNDLRSHLFLEVTVMKAHISDKTIVQITLFAFDFTAFLYIFFVNLLSIFSILSILSW